MRFFFSSRQFKVILAVVIILISISVAFVIIGGRISPQADVLGTVTAPFKAAATKLSQAVTAVVEAIEDNNEALLHNAELESELNELREKLTDYEKAKEENEFYKDYLEIKDSNPDFKFADATLISRNLSDPYGGFVINKGSVNGISENDPVITSAGLVGYITEVGLTTSKVATILSHDITLGAISNRTKDSGVLSGNLELAGKGLTRFYNLSRSCNIAIGDYVVTSGEGVFPDGLLVGVIETIGSDEYNTSIYAEVKPFAKLDEIRSVMVITDFEGKGGLSPDGE